MKAIEHVRKMYAVIKEHNETGIFLGVASMDKGC